MDGNTPNVPGPSSTPNGAGTQPGSSGGAMGDALTSKASSMVGNAASSVVSNALGDSGPQPTGENGELQAGDKVGNGKVMGEDGEVKASRGRKLVDNTETAGKIAAAVATGGGSAAAGEAAAGQAAGQAAAKEAGKKAAEETAKNAAESTAKNAAGNTAKAAQQMAKDAGNKSFDSNKMQEMYNKAKDSDAGKEVKEQGLEGVKNKIADEIDKAADENKALGAAIDEVNDILDPVTSLVRALESLLTLNFDGVKDNLKETVSGIKKLRKKLFKRLLIGAAIFLLFNVLIFVVVFGPTVGLYIEVTEGIKEMAQKVGEVVVDPDPGGGGGDNPGYDPGLPPDEWDPENIIEEVDKYISPDILAKVALDDYSYKKARAILCSQIPSFKSLSQQRRDMLYTAATLVAMNYTYLGCVQTNAAGTCTKWADCLWYKSGGLAGLKGCVVCDTYVGWVYMTKADTYLWMGGARQGAEQLLNKGITTEISKDQLMPGDIAWSNGHIGIYAGNGYYFHAAGKSKGVIKGKCGFNRFARFNPI